MHPLMEYDVIDVEAVYLIGSALDKLNQEIEEKAMDYDYMPPFWEPCGPVSYYETKGVHRWLMPIRKRRF